MHFQVQMKVRLKKPIEAKAGESSTSLAKDGRPVVGYFITMKVNAGDMADAMALAQKIALSPPDRTGNPRSFDGVVEQASAFEIEPGGGTEMVRPALSPADQRGVYYKTGLMFFHEGEDAEEEKKWWQFWKK
jgi:hypothetical protein